MPSLQTGQQGDRWTSQVIKCSGGIMLSSDVLTRGTENPGSAEILQNYEAADQGGYERVLGFAPYDTNALTGTGAVLGVGVGLGGVLAARKNGSDNQIRYSTGSGWSSPINGTARTGSVTKVRFKFYALTTAKVVVITDGVNHALKWDGTTATTLNGTGAPANPKYAEMHLGRLFLSGYSASPSGVTISLPGDDTDFNTSGAIELFARDTVIGLKKFRETLYIFCANGIQKLTGTSSTNFALEDVTTSISCISGDTIQEVAGDILFLAPDGTRSLAATERVGDVELGLVSTEVQPLLRDVIGAYSSDSFSTCVIRKKSQYRLFVYDSNIADSSAKGFIGKLKGPDLSRLSYEWSTLKGFNAYCSDSQYVGINEVSVFGHPTDGKVYAMETANSLNGSPIQFIYRSPQITFGDPSLRKVLHRALIFTQAKGDISVTLDTILGFDNINYPQPPSITLNQTGAVSVYDTAIYDTSVYSSIQYPVFREKLNGSGFTTSFQFSGSSTGASHRIDSFQLEFAIKGRR